MKKLLDTAVAAALEAGRLLRDEFDKPGGPDGTKQHAHIDPVAEKRISDILLDATEGTDAGIDVVSSEYATIAAEQSALENLSVEIADRIVTRVALTLRAQDSAVGD